MGRRRLGHRRIAAGARRWTAVISLCLVMCVGNLVAPAAHAVAPAVDPGGFVGLAPARLLDTRTSGPTLGAGQTRPLKVTGAGGVPSSGVSAVVLNVTVTETTSGGYLTVSPTGTPRPVVSNLNWSAGATIPNAVTVKVGSNGSVDLFQSGPGSAQVIVDVSGYYVDGTPTDPGAFTALTPSRILDTRTAGGGGKLAATETRDLQILGQGGVPQGTVSAVVLNVTVTETSWGGYLTVFPSGTTKPLASNLNWSAGATIPNLVIVKVGTNGKISLYQSGSGTAQVIVDVAGYFLGGTAGQPGMYQPVAPARILDTRNGAGPLRGGEDRQLSVAGTGVLPRSGVGAVVLNTTVTGTTAPGYLTVHPGFSPAPLASNLNWSGAGATIPNLVTVQLGNGGYVGFRNGSGTSTHVVADVAGYYKGDTPAPLKVTAVATGWYHTCAISSGEVWCWGRNNYGQLGNGNTTDSMTPVRTGVTGATAVVAGEAHTCAVANGNVWCWGLNANGQLGDNSGIDRSKPVLVPNLTGVTAIAAGKQHTCVVAGGSVWCWGWNSNGQLGDRSTTQRLGPVSVTGLSGAIAVTAGYEHTCAVTTAGTVRCWGYNYYGQLGDGTISDSLAPVTVSGLIGASAVAAGRLHTCAIASGTVKCWGYNGDGQLGDGTNANKPLPATVLGLTGVTSLAAGDGHNCAVSGASTASCWGENSYGQLGTGDTTDRTSPASVSGLSPVQTIVAGYTTSCALTTTGAMSCWGQNDYGQLGDGTTNDSNNPVPVTGMS